MAEANVDMISLSRGAAVGKVVIISNDECFAGFFDVAFDSGFGFGGGVVVVIVGGAVSPLWFFMC